MTGYEQFIKSNPSLKQGKIARLWELEVDKNIDNMIDFVNEFLSLKGFEKTGHKKDDDGIFKAVYNNNYIFAGSVQKENKIAIKINQF